MRIEKQGHPEQNVKVFSSLKRNFRYDRFSFYSEACIELQGLTFHLLFVELHRGRRLF